MLQHEACTALTAGLLKFKLPKIVYMEQKLLDLEYSFANVKIAEVLQVTDHANIQSNWPTLQNGDLFNLSEIWSHLSDFSYTKTSEKPMKMGL